MTDVVSSTNFAVSKKEGFVTRFVEYMRKRRMYQTTVNELSRLSDRELNDMGIHRGEIASIARETAGL